MFNRYYHGIGNGLIEKRSHYRLACDRIRYDVVKPIFIESFPDHKIIVQGTTSKENLLTAQVRGEGVLLVRFSYELLPFQSNWQDIVKEFADTVVTDNRNLQVLKSKDFDGLTYSPSGWGLFMDFETGVHYFNNDLESGYIVSIPLNAFIDSYIVKGKDFDSEHVSTLIIALNDIGGEDV